MAMTRVGERPRHREVGPSCRAILRSPSKVEVKFRRRVSSTAQSAAEDDVDDIDGLRVARVAVEEGLPAMQIGEVLLTQKTSRQQAVTPIFEGRFAKFEEGFGMKLLEVWG